MAAIRPTTMSIVRLKGVRKSYGAVTALSDIDLLVLEGEFLTLLGPSGSGKTTVLNVISGMIRPSAGRVFLRDADVTDVPPNKRQLGMVFQNYALMPHMTIFENVAFPLRVRKLPAASIRSKVAEVLEIVQLPDIAPQTEGAVGRAAAAGRDRALPGLQSLDYPDG